MALFGPDIVNLVERLQRDPADVVFARLVAASACNAGAAAAHHGG